MVFMMELGKYLYNKVSLGALHIPLAVKNCINANK